MLRTRAIAADAPYVSAGFQGRLLPINCHDALLLGRSEQTQPPGAPSRRDMPLVCAPMRARQLPIREFIPRSRKKRGELAPIAAATHVEATMGTARALEEGSGSCPAWSCRASGRAGERAGERASERGQERRVKASASFLFTRAHELRATGDMPGQGAREPAAT